MPRAIFMIPLLLSAGYFAYGRWESSTPFESRSFKSEITGETRRYAVLLPKDYHRNRGDWPAILYLHGLGESGDDLTQLMAHGLIREATLDMDLPFVIIAPQAMMTMDYRLGWRNNEADVLKVLREAQKKYRIDPDRIYLTGNSMGGIGSFYMASRHPDLFAAVAPIAGQGDTSWTSQYHGLPFWVFHGLKDDIIPARGSDEMVEAMKSNDVDVRYTPYPTVTHDSWTQTYRNPELYKWFLQHRRGGVTGA